MNEKAVFVQPENRLDAIVSEYGPLFLQEIPEDALSLKETITVPIGDKEIGYEDTVLTYTYSLEELFPNVQQPKILTISTTDQPQIIIITDGETASFAELKKQLHDTLDNYLSLITDRERAIHFAQIPVIYDPKEEWLLFGLAKAADELNHELQKDRANVYTSIAPHGTMLAFNRYYSALYKNKTDEPYEPYGENASFVQGCKYFELKYSAHSEVYINATAAMLPEKLVTTLRSLGVKMGNEITPYEGTDSLFNRIKEYIPFLIRVSGNSRSSKFDTSISVIDCITDSITINGSAQTVEGHTLKILQTILGSSNQEKELTLQEIPDTYIHSQGFPVSGMLLEKDGLYTILVSKTHQDQGIQQYINQSHIPVAMLDCNLRFRFPPDRYNTLGLDLEIKTLKPYLQIEEYRIKKPFFSYKESQFVMNILVDLVEKFNHLTHDQTSSVQHNRYPRLTI